MAMYHVTGHTLSRQRQRKAVHPVGLLRDERIVFAVNQVESLAHIVESYAALFFLRGSPDAVGEAENEVALAGLENEIDERGLAETDSALSRHQG